MQTFRKILLFLFLISLLIQSALTVLPSLYGSVTQTPVDDWQYRYIPDNEDEPASATIYIQEAPRNILLAWLAIESLRQIFLLGLIKMSLFIAFIGGILLSVSGPMIGSITDQGVRSAERSMSYAVGGAKDINNFRKNIASGYLPQPSDITYEGLFYDYFFAIGSQTTELEPGKKALFSPVWSRAESRNPISGENEIFLAIGLKSDLKASDFARKKLNLVIVLDISYSMSSAFNRYYYGGAPAKGISGREDFSMTKLESACKSIVAMLDHLRPDDRLGIALFDHESHLAKPVSLLSLNNIEALKQHILDLRPAGGTNMEEGMELGEKLLKPFSLGNMNDYENRMIFMTDAMPNCGDFSEEGLLGISRRMAKNNIFTTFIGMGVDFDTELVESISKVRGANYYSVHSPSEFKKRLAEEFDYMVTPMIFDLNLSLTSNDYRIKKVIGSPDTDLASAKIFRVRTLFPSPSSEEGGKGGVILVQLDKLGENHGKLNIDIEYTTRDGEKSQNSRQIDFSGIAGESFDDNGTRKAVLLYRYADLLKNTATSPRKVRVASLNDRTSDGSGWSYWERSGQKLEIPALNLAEIEKFKEYFIAEQLIIKDSALEREAKTLNNLARIARTAD